MMIDLHRRLLRPALATMVTVWFALTLAPTASAQLKVVATTPDLAAIAKEVGGDLVDVTALAKPNEDPHYVDPKPNLILKLNKADVLMSVGLGLESGWLPPLQVQARNKKVTTGGSGFFDASTHVRKLEVPSEIDRSRGDIHPGGNPHYLFDPRAAMNIGRALASHFGKLDTDNAATYAANAERFVTELQGVTRKHAERFAELGADERRVVVYHQSLPYLLDWLSLERAVTIEPKPGIPPNPSHVASVLKTMKSKGIKVIVQEEFYPTKTSKTLAKVTGGHVVVLHGGTRFQRGERYIEHVDHVASQIYDALTEGR